MAEDRYHCQLMDPLNSARYVVNTWEEVFHLTYLVGVDDFTRAICLAGDAHGIRVFDSLTVSVLALYIVHFLSMCQLLIISLSSLLDF